ncbi:PadR family transcriptional regulator [Streptomyces sp. IB201691-2A2]|uniref:PadR family transcriptional regulator n=1 Tax=Streptomyces sp. IB201691-2A2 TaxID=2561920 RepID=UPI00117C80F2|nr:PadR family transcriptional regulator [Streptomyces sp. IB201691-2A2]TRO60532.1 PadR family transcriptional regulator [Streptomyces sp. IB201691-2A2]
MADLNPTAASLLGFLHGGEASGYELVHTAEQLIGDFWTLTRSQVYRELAALAGRGLVEAGPAGPRSRQPYRLTDEGRAAFAAWLAEPPGSEQIRYPLLLTIAFGSALDRDRLTEFIAGHRADHEKRLADYRERVAAGAPDRFTEATLAFGIRYEEAVLAWMDELPAILDGQ